MDRDDTAIPFVPLALGLAGLVPFWALAIGIALHGAFGLATPALFDLALATYAAVIVSFLGGIRWGLAVGRGDRAGFDYAISIVPSLTAWAALATPEPWRLGLLAVVAAGLGPVDLGLVGAGGAPIWFGRLRIILSTGAGIALAFGALSIRQGNRF